MAYGQPRRLVQRRLLPRRWSFAAVSCILAAGVAVPAALQCFVGYANPAATETPRHLRLRVAANDVAADAVATTPSPGAVADADDGPGLLQGERYIAMNRFQVREGAEAQFEQRWAGRKSSLLTLDGFRWFGLLQRVLPSGDDPKPYADDYSYVSFTIWETKKNFNSWRKGPAFKEAHGGGGPIEFFSMIISGFMTSKGPPKPAFWRGMLMEKTLEEKPRLLSGPGGRPDADGSITLEPDVFVSMNRFSVAEGREQEFEQRWATRESKLQGMPGFRFFQLMRRDQTPDDDVNYISMAVWDNRGAFDNWRNGEGFKKAHGRPTGKEGAKPPASHGSGGSGGAPMGGVLTRPPIPFFYEGKLILESELGA